MADQITGASLLAMRSLAAQATARLLRRSAPTFEGKNDER